MFPARLSDLSLAMKKLVYLVRHGEADWPDWDEPDDERPLTRKGKAEVKRVAKFLRRLRAEPLLIFTSPLPRAAQTAKIIAKELCLELGVEDGLGKRFDFAEFQRIVTQHDVREMVLVGHEPTFTDVIAAVTGARAVLAKSGVALIEAEASGASGTLRWLFPPRLARRR